METTAALQVLRDWKGVTPPNAKERKEKRKKEKKKKLQQQQRRS